MENAPSGTNHNPGAIVSDLILPVEHVEASIELIDATIARESSRGDSDAANVIVLDDVTPQYLRVSQALQLCSASLDVALWALLEARPPARDSMRLARG
jgi:hypothetical protein